MKVKALTTFNDLKTNIIRKNGEIFDITPKRAEEINSGPHGVLIEVIDKPQKESGDPNAGKSKRQIKSKIF